MCYVKPTAGCRRYTPFPGTTRAPSSLGPGCMFSYLRGFLGSGDQLTHQANIQGRDSKIEGGGEIVGYLGSADIYFSGKRTGVK